MVEAAVLSWIISVAELGDKSQLMALTFAARYRAMPILIGITVATALVHALSVLLGAALGASLPTQMITIVAGVAFLGFAAWTLRGDELTEDDAARARRTRRSAAARAQESASAPPCCSRSSVWCCWSKACARADGDTMAAR